MTTQNQGEWINGLACTSAGFTRKRTRPVEAATEIETEVVITQTDEEIRAEFDAAAARQTRYARVAEDTTTETLSYSSAGATRRR